MQITITKADQLKPKPDENKLGFGTIFTDHMFNMDYSVEKGWHNAPYRTLPPVYYGSFHHGPALRARGF
jgi:branched-chain amino acid aminotransferase